MKRWLELLFRRPSPVPALAPAPVSPPIVERRPTPLTEEAWVRKKLEYVSINHPIVLCSLRGRKPLPLMRDLERQGVVNCLVLADRLRWLDLYESDRLCMAEWLEKMKTDFAKEYHEHFVFRADCNDEVLAKVSV